MIYLLASVGFLAWGIWCFISIFRKKKIQVQVYSNDEFLPKKILGKYYDLAMNLVYGTIAIFFGVFGVLHYFKKM